uniref:SRCR domain-containing protein n=1 Tax=Erpetoichthys calabaricus TaxID=27687 RepID=A0A8C4RH61_ERPCA
IAPLEKAIFNQNFGVRLSGGPSRCEGWVEVYYKKDWARVMMESWSSRDATVVCRQLGCGTRTQMANSSQYKKSSKTVCLKGFLCSGNEKHLGSFCPLVHYFLVDVCYLLSGLLNNPNLLFLHVLPVSAWVSAGRSGFLPQSKDMQMGCYFFVIKAEHFSNCIWLLAVELRWLVLIGSWSQFCTSYFCFPDHLDLRLTNGTSVCDGRLEIFYNGSWGTVCDDSWDLPDANVVCRQLQCEAAVEAITPVSYGPGSGHIWLDDVHCQGNESSLSICTHRGWGQNDCRHKEDVGVNCTGRLIILVVSV